MSDKDSEDSPKRDKLPPAKKEQKPSDLAGILEVTSNNSSPAKVIDAIPKPRSNGGSTISDHSNPAERQNLREAILNK